ncbi:HBR089Wp [Eremothecium sinecaudum]|uniref:HBR089Wp n=1 Tax=Eremothecium sinecaudum TaxID=45286 RepID=A0A120K146_9SACH|nr:HBR089Wp [Eremothecium sinecaudum]AMD18990.1 HBR089Wp [Eremothecium sinecaudum]
MAVWSHLDVSKAHVGYACIGVFSCIFSLVSLFVKEKLYIGESTCAVIFGLIVGPHCLNWFDPTEWGNTDAITLEISRMVLCLQIFAVAVELPKKYMLKHWLSVTMLLVPVMTTGWLIIGLFIWLLIPGLNFSSSLLISACITATDPILAQSVVSGKFAERVPGHLRNLLSAESGCNDGMAFPFIYLSFNLVVYPKDGRKILKDWFCVTILYECVFGCFLGIVIGYAGRRAIRYTEGKKIIDRESFLAFYVVLATMCAGFGSILGVDDLLVSFAAGATFAWDGWFAKKTEESKVSTVIDLLLNLAYFVYFGAIIPWKQFNDPLIGTTVWRLILLAVVVITLRRIPAVLFFKGLIPDIKSWREALFVGHFGPIGVGAIFAAILARAELEGHATGEETPLKELPAHGTEHWQLIACVWPIVCFLIVTSIIVHGSSVAVITLGRHLNTITLTKSFTTQTTNGNNRSSAWMQRLPGLDKSGRSFSLHRIDTLAPPDNIQKSQTIETSGVPAKPAGGMRKRKQKVKRRKAKDLFGTASRRSDYEQEEVTDLKEERLARERQAKAAAFALTRDDRHLFDEKLSVDSKDKISPTHSHSCSIEQLLEQNQKITPPNSLHHSTRRGGEQKLTPEQTYDEIEFPKYSNSSSNEYDYKGPSSTPDDDDQQPTIAYQEGNSIILENRRGEIVAHTKMYDSDRDLEEGSSADMSSMPSTERRNSLRRLMSPPFFRRSTLVDDERGAKYHAYRVNDVLIIENEDGEVLRRYRINTHNSDKASQTKKRSSSVVSKALSVVGLGKSTSKAQQLQAPSSVAAADKTLTSDAQVLSTTEHPKLTPVPSIHTSSGENRSEKDNEDEGDITPLKSKHFQSKEITEASEESEDDEDEEDEDEEDEEEEGHDEEEKETAIERARRLTALGEYSAPRDDDDEEIPPVVGQTTADIRTPTVRK